MIVQICDRSSVSSGHSQSAEGLLVDGSVHQHVFRHSEGSVSVGVEFRGPLSEHSASSLLLFILSQLHYIRCTSWAVWAGFPSTTLVGKQSDLITQLGMSLSTVNLSAPRFWYDIDKLYFFIFPFYVFIPELDFSRIWGQLTHPIKQS